MNKKSKARDPIDAEVGHRIRIHRNARGMSQTALGDKTYEDKHYYKGTLDGDTIRFSMLTDSGAESHVPIHFTARR